MLKYVSMELAEGKLPDGKIYISKEPLLERRAPQVYIGKDLSYGMGLIVETTYAVPVVHHGGDLFGYDSDMIWLPQQDVGVVILTNSDPGWLIRDRFRRKLLEVLFDGRPEADALSDGTESGRLSRHYHNAALGNIDVSTSGASTIFDFGEWKSEVGSRKNPDGTISFITIAPSVDGFEFVVSSGAKPTLTIRDGQHEYVFDEQ